MEFPSRTGLVEASGRVGIMKRSPSPTTTSGQTNILEALHLVQHYKETAQAPRSKVGWLGAKKKMLGADLGGISEAAQKKEQEHADISNMISSSVTQFQTVTIDEENRVCDDIARCAAKLGKTKVMSTEKHATPRFEDESFLKATFTQFSRLGEGEEILAQRKQEVETYTEAVVKSAMVEMHRMVCVEKRPTESALPSGWLRAGGNDKKSTSFLLSRDRILCHVWECPEAAVLFKRLWQRVWSAIHTGNLAQGLRAPLTFMGKMHGTYVSVTVVPIVNIDVQPVLLPAIGGKHTAQPHVLESHLTKHLLQDVFVPLEGTQLSLYQGYPSATAKNAPVFIMSIKQFVVRRLNKFPAVLARTELLQHSSAAAPPISKPTDDGTSAAVANSAAAQDEELLKRVVIPAAVAEILAVEEDGKEEPVGTSGGAIKRWVEGGRLKGTLHRHGINVCMLFLVRNEFKSRRLEEHVSTIADKKDVRNPKGGEKLNRAQVCDLLISCIHTEMLIRTVKAVARAELASISGAKGLLSKAANLEEATKRAGGGAGGRLSVQPVSPTTSFGSVSTVSTATTARTDGTTSNEDEEAIRLALDTRIEVPNILFRLITSEQSFWDVILMPALQAKFRCPAHFVLPMDALHPKLLAGLFAKKFGCFYNGRLGRFTHFVAAPIQVELIGAELPPSVMDVLATQQSKQSGDQELGPNEITILSQWKAVHAAPEGSLAQQHLATKAIVTSIATNVGRHLAKAYLKKLDAAIEKDEKHETETPQSTSLSQTSLQVEHQQQQSALKLERRFIDPLAKEIIPLARAGELGDEGVNLAALDQVLLQREFDESYRRFLVDEITSFADLSKDHRYQETALIAPIRDAANAAVRNWQRDEMEGRKALRAQYRLIWQELAQACTDLQLELQSFLLDRKQTQVDQDKGRQQILQDEHQFRAAHLNHDHYHRGQLESLEMVERLHLEEDEKSDTHKFSEWRRESLEHARYGVQKREQLQISESLQRAAIMASQIIAHVHELEQPLSFGIRVEVAESLSATVILTGISILNCQTGETAQRDHLETAQDEAFITLRSLDLIEQLDDTQDSERRFLASSEALQFWALRVDMMQLEVDKVLQALLDEESRSLLEFVAEDVDRNIIEREERELRRSLLYNSHFGTLHISQRDERLALDQEGERDHIESHHEGFYRGLVEQGESKVRVELRGDVDAELRKEVERQDIRGRSAIQTEEARERLGEVEEHDTRCLIDSEQRAVRASELGPQYVRESLEARAGKSVVTFEEARDWLDTVEEGSVRNEIELQAMAALRGTWFVVQQEDLEAMLSCQRAETAKEEALAHVSGVEEPIARNLGVDDEQSATFLHLWNRSGWSKLQAEESEARRKDLIHSEALAWREDIRRIWCYGTESERRERRKVDALLRARTSLQRANLKSLNNLQVTDGSVPFHSTAALDTILKKFQSEAGVEHLEQQSTRVDRIQQRERDRAERGEQEESWNIHLLNNEPKCKNRKHNQSGRHSSLSPLHLDNPPSVSPICKQKQQEDSKKKQQLGRKKKPSITSAAPKPQSSLDTKLASKQSKVQHHIRRETESQHSSRQATPSSVPSPECSPIPTRAEKALTPPPTATTALGGVSQTVLLQELHFMLHQVQSWGQLDDAESDSNANSTTTSPAKTRGAVTSLKPTLTTSQTQAKKKSSKAKERLSPPPSSSTPTPTTLGSTALIRRADVVADLSKTPTIGLSNSQKMRNLPPLKKKF